jgi:hypothetical protein
VKHLLFSIPTLLLLATGPTSLAAQSISPPISEYRGGKARGSFVVTNQTLFPLTVVLQPKGFQVNEDGDLYDIPLDTAVVKLRLSTLSFRLQPRQAYTVFYEADADTVPYWFNVWSGITGSKTESGINLRIELPHVVYLYQKLKLAEPDITIRSVRYRPAEHQVIVEFANTSPRLGRVQSVLASADKVKSQEAAGFPLFPNSIRRMRMPWADSLPPQKVEVRFDGFRLTSTSIAIDTSAAPPSPVPADTAARDSSAAR